MTCGADDADRLAVSRVFACRRREAGGRVLFKILPGGHDLGADARAFACAWLAAFAAAPPAVRAWGEEGTGRIRPLADIEPEDRNPLYTEDLETRWRR